MIKVHIFRNCDEDYVIEEMMKLGSKHTGLLVSQGTKIKQGDMISMPKHNTAKAIRARRRVFFFWLWECLVVQNGEYGKYYMWYNKSKLTFE